MKKTILILTLLCAATITQAQAPTSVSVVATQITFETATLNALVNPNGATTTVSFEYGLTTSYGSTASLSGTISGTTLQFKSTSLSGLTECKTYHYRVKAVNTTGTSYGNEMTFTTASNFTKQNVNQSTMLLGINGMPYTSGWNTVGQLGDNTTTGRNFFNYVSKGAYSGTTYLGDDTSNQIVKITKGGKFSLALAKDGTVYTWGENGAGQLGDNTTTNRHTPVKVLKGVYSGTTYLGDNSSNPIVDIAAGNGYSIAVAADGTVYSWGQGVFGPLGVNSWTNYSTPVQVLKGAYNGTTYLGDDSNNPILSIYTSNSWWVMALAADGTIYNWGRNDAGQLGDSTTTERGVPVRVLKGAYSGTTYLGDNTSNPIIQINAGYIHASALAADGTVFSWGQNTSGQFGDSTLTNSYIPVQAVKGNYSGTTYLGDNTSNPIRAIATGNRHTLALAANGTVFSYGDNPSGALGNCAAGTNRNYPSQVLKGSVYSGTTYLGDASSNPVVSVGAGVYSSYSLMRNGNVYSWGSNQYGQLGVASTTTTGCAPVRTEAIGGGGTLTLPVELIHFTAQAIAHTTAELNWATATEIDNSYFVIERSYDGLNFEVADRIEGNGNSDEVLHYAYTDRGIAQGSEVVYYRLHQFDYNGASDYSDVRKVSFGMNSLDKLSIAIYPNPFTSDVYINVSTLSGAEATIKVANLSGQQLLERSLNTTQSIEKVDLSSLPKGIYFVHVTSATGTTIVKVIKG
jgi:alpha-tubulin suppressor-like RCC1 family protein